MRAPIPLTLAEQPSVEIEGATVAQGLGLPVEEFRQLMEDRKIKVLCERGTGEDAGLYRASFYLGPQRFRVVVDASGQVVQAD